MVPVALTFAVLHLTGSVSDLGIVLAAQNVPLVVFVLLGGVWADRLPRQLVMLTSDLVRFAAQGASAALVLEGSAQVWQLAVLQAVYGVADGFFIPAANGLVPQVVGKEDLQRANALLGLSENTASILGPAAAGVIVVGAGAGWGLFVDAATFMLSAAFLSALRVKPALRAAGTRTTSVMRELRDGWQTFRSRRWLLISVVYFTLMFAFGFSTFKVLGPEVAERFLGGPGAWGGDERDHGRWRPGGRPGGAALETGAPPEGGVHVLAVRGTGDAVAARRACPAGADSGDDADRGRGGSDDGILFTAIQGVPADELSRVTSWDAVGSYALQPAGLAVVGPLAGAIGVSTTLYGAGAIFLLITLGLLMIPSIRDFTGGTQAAQDDPASR